MPRSFPIGRLNNYNKTMKKHKGPLSLMSELESIDEVELSDKYEKSSQQQASKNNIGGNEDFYYDADDPNNNWFGIQPEA